MNPIGVIFIGSEVDACSWAKGKFGVVPDVFRAIDKITHLRDFMRWMRLTYDPPHCAVVELPPRAHQVQLLKPVEDMKATRVVFYTTAVNAALPTLRGRCTVVKGPEPIVPDQKMVDKLIAVKQSDHVSRVAVYRESGEIDKNDLHNAIKGAQLTASGDRSLVLLTMLQLIKRSRSAKEFVVLWLWGI